MRSRAQGIKYREHRQNNENDFSTTLRDVYQHLQAQCQETNTTHEIFLEQNGYRILAVWTGLEGSLDASQLRASVGKMMGLETFNIIQIVGDSSTKYTEQGIAAAKDAILPFFKQGENGVKTSTILEYGYTASQCDINWIVNEIVTSIPGLTGRTIGNVVHTSIDVVESGQHVAAGNIRNLVLAYNAGETVFGSDMWLSDSIMSKALNDKLICLEGGPQTFAQAVNAALAGVSVTAITGPRLRATPPTLQGSKFSAAQFLRHLCGVLPGHVVDPADSAAERAALAKAGSAYLETATDLLDGSSRKEVVVAAMQKIVQQPKALNVVQIRLIADEPTTIEV